MKTLFVCIDETLDNPMNVGGSICAPRRSLWPGCALWLRRGLATVREIVQIAVRDESGKVRNGWI
jgi:hypothetical protein